MKTIEMLVGEIKASVTLQKLLAEAAKNNTVSTFLKEQGCEATADEFIAALKAPMSDDDLDTVSGGANGLEAVISVFTIGVGCAFLACESATGSGVGDGKHGAILCNDLYL